MDVTSVPAGWLYLVPLALALLVIADAMLKMRRRVFISKKYSDGEVAVEVRNGSEELAGLRVIDQLPADAKVGALGGGQLVEGPLGRSVRWSVPALMPGERRTFRYGLRTNAKELPGAEAGGTVARQVKARSAGVRL